MTLRCPTPPSRTTSLTQTHWWPMQKMGRNNHQINDDVPHVPLAVYSWHVVKPDSNSGAIVTLTMPTFTLSALTEVLLTIMSCIRKHPRTKMLLKILHFSAIASLRLRIQRFSFPLRRDRIKSPLRPLQMTTKDCSAVKKHYDWTKRSWTCSGSTQSHGTASRMFGAPRVFSHRQGSSLLCNKLSTPSSVPSRTTMEGSRAQQLAPPGASRCQSLGEQLRALLGRQT